MNKMRMAKRVCVGAAILVFAASAGWREPRITHAQSAAMQASALFTKQDVMIPTRDGVKLHTEIYTPKNASGSLPFMITRTPYGLSDDDKGYSHLLGL